VSHDGALWQARCDSAERPSTDATQWALIARAARDGLDGMNGLEPNPRGDYDTAKTYARLDIVGYEGASYIARRDAAGLPGVDPAWQLLAAHGTKGERGELGAPGARGPRGDQGDAGATIVSWQIDPAHYRASPLMSDGRVGPMLELRGLFEQFQSETA
jgi:hypothetical protein